MKNLLCSSALLMASMVASILSPSAQAMELDWSGQFRTEFTLVNHYGGTGNDSAAGVDTGKAAGKGYYVPGGGGTSAKWETLFLRLRPKLVVNDNVYIKSEWWVGNPIYGMFGDAAPTGRDQRHYDSTFSRGSFITAQRFWAEFLSDFGTIQIGRVPLGFGLGLVWNDGNGLWDRYQSTGDAVRLISKFGAFSFIPSFILYNTGNTVGGACDATPNAATGLGCTPGGAGSARGAVSDYSLIFKYDNIDEDFEGGVNFIHRLARDNSYVGPQGTPVGMNYNTWDIYAKKRLGMFTLGGEFPIITGNVGGVEYKTYAAALEAQFRPADRFALDLKLGHAPGQANSPTGSLTKYTGFYFHPNYKLGFVMFNYQLRNLGGLQTQNDAGAATGSLDSPYDNPITNANYLGLSGSFTADKWKFNAGFVYAKASTTAVANEQFFNTWDRRMSGTLASKSQGSSLGWEMDYGATLHYDETFQFGGDVGFFFPGDYYKFNGSSADDNPTGMVLATQLRVGINF